MGDKNINLVENDTSGLTDAEKDPDALRRASRWITRRGWALTITLVILWPLLSIPARVFTQEYFAFWVFVAIIWGFGAAIIITVLPLTESQDEIGKDLSGLKNFASFKKGEGLPKEVDKAQDEEAAAPKEATKE